MYFQPLATNPGLDRRGISIKKPALISETALRAAYEEALRRPAADMPLSRRRGTEYAAVRKNRRADLEAILRAGVSGENRERALDLICAICEESSWTQSPEYPFADAMHPGIDFFAGETACLLAWCCRCGGFDALTQSRMLHEIRARIITPLSAHDDYPCLLGEDRRSLAAVCDAMAAALLAETDSARLYTFLRRMSRIADSIIDSYAPAPIDDALADWTAACAVWLIFREISGPSAGRALPRPDWMDSLAVSYVGGGEFIDPMGDGMHRASGADIFFLGRAAGDEYVRLIGAEVGRIESAPLSSINARMTGDIASDMLSETRPAAKLRHGAAAGGSIMMARGGGLMAAMYAAGRKNAGGLYITMDNSPVIAPMPDSGAVINGLEQNMHHGDGYWEFDDARADMFCDVTACYPSAAGVRLYQRTLMLDRGDGSARIIDIIETDRPGSIRVRFPVPENAAVDEGGARIGAARLSWDSARPELRKHDTILVIELEYSLEIGRNMIGFMIERADGSEISKMA